MARLLEDAYWLYEENVSSPLFPRTYGPSTDQQAFVENFRLTAGAGLLKWFVRGRGDSCGQFGRTTRSRLLDWSLR